MEVRRGRANTIAHRVGDCVFTGHGIDLAPLPMPDVVTQEQPAVGPGN